ncbi:MAG: alpha/beta hydrolase [Acetobacter indonesiensis]|jgi:pimeloyl-[acyl-carrier protein] methyl ester esterase|nr:alpha/beta hydrolase [Acetobacter indonesiensis]MCI1545285.1 alpha/beta hydrolase [Acetobacter indonesiensis]MCI1764471.1 alpha/beta hydrolase [Acetobacter indonesiensis]
MTLQPVFVHGWACGVDVWQPLSALLPSDAACFVDLGYFTSSDTVPLGLECLEQIEADRPILGIGHSLGLMWLLAQRKWPEGSRFVGINAFARFTQDEGFAQGVAPRVLARMATGLQRAPADVVNNFRERCGLQPVEGASLQISALQDGLQMLMTGDVRCSAQELTQHRQPNLLVLAGAADPIVSPDMTRAAFAPETLIVWEQGGGHMLPLTHTRFCADQIRQFMNETS